jgi:hypothetical protein
MKIPTQGVLLPLVVQFEELEESRLISKLNLFDVS